ncbi:MAG TPA: hypothetical protein VNL71_10440 [Chloroflexota bacterium]|nr:hypothetical protein [Chloroflexota bacterium]
MFFAPLCAAIIGGVFAAVVLRQYGARRKPYQACWGGALALFAVAAALEAFASISGWTPFTYKVYYLFGAILNVGWLGVGSLYILSSRWGRLGAVLMGVITIAAIPVVAVSPTDHVLLLATVPGRGAIGNPAPIFPLVTNIAGSILLIGGAARSAWVDLRRRAPWGRVTGLSLIAAGAFLVAITHTLAQTRGVYLIEPLGEAFGIVVMFAGYLAVEAQRIPLLDRRPVAQ